jgi:hypothetical protein
VASVLWGWARDGFCQVDGVCTEHGNRHVFLGVTCVQWMSHLCAVRLMGVGRGGFCQVDGVGWAWSCD